MLTRHTVTSATAVKKYFSTADYYTEGQETVGQWIGELARAWGLSGKVTKAEFERLCDNLHPVTGEKLTLRTNKERRVGTDFVFSGPKSFSVIEGLADLEEKRRLLKAFDEAITETLTEEMEPDVQARVRKRGADYDRTTGNMAAAGYDHSTARPLNDKTPPDPHRHRHVLWFNVTYDPEEKCFKAAQMGNIVRDRPYYQAAFFARLASRLEGLGYVIDRRADGKWEIAGVPQSVIDKFSKRTDEIEDAARRLGITDAGEKAGLAAKTRSKKQKELTPEQLRTAWDAQLSDGERDALAAVYRREIAPGREITAAEAVEYAIADRTEKLSVLPERELKRVALLHGLGSVTPDDISREMRAPRYGLITGEIDGRLMATTAELQAEEDYLAGIAARGRGTLQPVGVADGLSRTLSDGTVLNDGQWEAATGLLESSNRVNLVEGPAGAGKSSMLGKLDEGLRQVGESVTYLATTSKAAGVLQKDGFDTKTVAHFLVDEKMQAAARGGRVVVDESSMLGHKDAVAFFKLVEKLDLKPVFVGDPAQHGSVARGAFLHVLKEYGGIRPFKLTQIMRQERPDYLAATTLLSEKRTLEAFEALDGMGWVKEMDDHSERYRAIAAEYLQALDDKKSLLVVSPTHAEAASITAAIRSDLRADGKLGGEEQKLTRLVEVDASEAARAQALTYKAGDVLQFHQNAKGGIKKGDRLIVSDPAAVPFSEAGKFSLYRPEAIVLSERDLIRFTGTVKSLDGKHTLRNGTAHRVAEITPGGNIRLDNGWIVAKDAGHFRHGYVETSFGSQGTTVQRAILAVSSRSGEAANREMAYVGSTRAKEWMTLYTDDKDAIRAAIQRSSQKLAAKDLKPKKADDKAADRRAEQRQRRKRWAFNQKLRAAWSNAGRPQTTPPRAPTRASAQASQQRQHERESGYAR